MKIPNRFIISAKEPRIEMPITSLRKAKKTARKLSKYYDTEVHIYDSLTGVVQYIIYEYVDNGVAKV